MATRFGAFRLVMATGLRGEDVIIERVKGIGIMTNDQWDHCNHTAQNLAGKLGARITIQEYVGVESEGSDPDGWEAIGQKTPWGML